MSTQALQLMQLVWPSIDTLPGYVDALERGWSHDNARGKAAADEELVRIAQDPVAFIAGMVDREAKGPPVVMPDGSTVPRLPGYRRWMWAANSAAASACAGSPGRPRCRRIASVTSVTRSSRGNRIAANASAALQAMLVHAREEGLPFVEVTTDPDNLASQRVIEKNGGVLYERFTKPEQFDSKSGLRYRIAVS